MKHLLFLCVIALCITRAFLIEKTGTQSQESKPKKKKLHKCILRLRKEVCTNGFCQDIVDADQQCSNKTFESSSWMFQVWCTPDLKGGYCEPDPKLDITACDNESNLECRNNLIRAKRLGCCMASVYNDSAFYVQKHALFNLSLWLDYSIEPVAIEGCLPSHIRVSPSYLDPTCNCIENILSRACRHKYMDAISSMLAIEECSNTTHSAHILKNLHSTCAANRFGVYCGTIQNDLDNLFAAASESCSNTSTCDPLCIETLNNITNTVGCCFNENYNTTNSTVDWLSDEFWSKCNLKSPGLCKIRLADEGR